MSDINSVILIGRVTRDGEMKTTSGGTAILSFSIAVGRSIPPQSEGGEWKNEASFIDCTAWAKLAESKSKHILKGKQLCVQGELRQDRWEQDGQARSKLYIVCESIQLLADPRTNTSQNTPETPAPEAKKDTPARAYSPPKPWNPYTDRKVPSGLFAGDAEPKIAPGRHPHAPPGDDFTDDIPF